MNVEIGPKAATQFLFCEYINRLFLAVNIIYWILGIPNVTGSCLAAEAVGPDAGSAVDRDDADGGGVGGGGGGWGGRGGQPVEEVLGLPARAGLQSWLHGRHLGTEKKKIQVWHLEYWIT